MRFVGVLGLLVILAIAWALSTDRRRIAWRTVIAGTALQLLFALLILKTPWGRSFFDYARIYVTAFLNFADAGSEFIFGEDYTDHFFAFKVLPTIIFFSSVIAILYHLGALQWVVKLFARVMMWLMRTSGAESLSASANIFVGQTEAPLLIRPYVGAMTRSELMAVMTGGFATVAGGVLALYVGMGISAGHLIAASVMSAPAALVMAKLMVPETEDSKTAGNVEMSVDLPYVNVIDAAAQGAADGLRLALNVGAMLLAFLGLIALINGILEPIGGVVGVPGLNLEGILGFVLSPLAWLMGVPWEEARAVGGLLGIKTGANELIAYTSLSDMIQNEELSERSQVIATYALCGFSNFSSIAIQIGGIGGIAPERKGDLARLGLRAMIAGSLACFQTATIAGLLI
ncbi:MAG TPA: NupC/NupG family nucleoside CNT transporter [Thermoanaerobaculia bacterium]|nr:NupC/NupG family nucleoside CNT transporter [Thermoanaerobaculia bacterium]